MVTSLLDLSNHARAAASVGDRATITEAVAEIETRLRLPRRQIADELHGRKPVDALLNLALAGEHNAWIFDELCAHADDEVRRWGHRRSCTSMTLAQLAERAAAAGCRGPLGLYDTIGNILRTRDEPTYASVARALDTGRFSLATSHNAARWVYRASARQSKEASASADGFAATDWTDVSPLQQSGAAGAPPPHLAFADCRRPLTVDLGSGFGCGPLCFADGSRLDLAASDGSNVLGCDLSAAGVGYARGLASRWGVAGACRFVRADARAALQAAASGYPGGVQRVVLSCPTPYAQPLSLEDEDEDEEASGRDDESLGSGNSQLPTSASDPSFLGHPDVFRAIAEALPVGGELYLASNVEDVALTLLSHAERVGFEPLVAATEVSSTGGGSGGGVAMHDDEPRPDEASRVPRRQERWRRSGGARADGECWRAARRMPWASETERTHALEGRPIHRVVCRKVGD